MRLLELRLENLRGFATLELELAPRLNIFVGGNGAGKTTLLEAVYLLSHARSFRSGSRDALLRHGAQGLSVFGLLEREHGGNHRIGLVRNGARWQARIDTRTPNSLVELLRHCAVVCFEPGSHELIAGASEQRRGFLDWGLFHVEPDFLPAWRFHQRALKQRNVLLKQNASATALVPWDRELDAAASRITQQRQHYLDALRPHLRRMAANLLGELGEPQLVFNPGWDASTSLLETLERARPRDLARGFTSNGAHRADWRLVFPAAPLREHLSRGQEKLVALTCVLAQAHLFAEQRGEWPIVCLDDLASELDQTHQRQVVAALGASGAQLLLTGTELPAALQDLVSPPHMFHVEQGRVTSLL